MCKESRLLFTDPCKNLHCRADPYLILGHHPLQDVCIDLDERPVKGGASEVLEVLHPSPNTGIDDVGNLFHAQVHFSL